MHLSFISYIEFMLTPQTAILKSGIQTQHNSKLEEFDVFRDDSIKILQVFVFYTKSLHFCKIRNFPCVRHSTVHHQVQLSPVRTKHPGQCSLCEQLCTHCVLTTKAAWKPCGATRLITDKNTLTSLHIEFWVDCWPVFQKSSWLLLLLNFS